MKTAPLENNTANADDPDDSFANTAECGWDGGDCVEHNKHNKLKLYERIWLPPETAKDNRLKTILCMLVPILCLVFVAVVTRSKGGNKDESAASDAAKEDAVKEDGQQDAMNSKPHKKAKDEDDDGTRTCMTKDSDEEEGPWWRFNH